MKKKILCFITAAALLTCAAMVSCGNDDTDTKDSLAGEAQTYVRSDAESVAESLRNGIEYVDDLNVISAEMIEKLYGIPSDKYTSGAVYVGGVSTAEEIACFDAADEDAAEEIKAACEKRIADQIASVQDYNPDELDKLNDPVLLVSGNSVYMCLSNDNASAEKILENNGIS